MSRIVISDLSQLEPSYDVPIVLNGVSGDIDGLEIESVRNSDAPFLLVLIDCRLTIRNLRLEGAHPDLYKQHWRQYAPNGLMIVGGNVTIDGFEFDNLHIGAQLRGNASLSNGSINLCSGDFIQLCADYASVSNVACTGSLDVLGSAYHRDVVQLFPTDGKNELSGCAVDRVSYRPSGHKWDSAPQGILASDGIFNDIAITNCDLQGVHESHGISFLVTANNCRLSDNITNGLIRIDASCNESVNNVMGQSFAPTQSKRDNFMSKLIKKTAVGGDLLQWAADTLGVELAVIQAVIEVESSGKTGAMLFERHKFYDALQEAGVNISELLRKNQALAEIINPLPYKRGRVGKDVYGTHKKQAERLDWAKRIGPEAALKATSWGQFQIMGFNHKLAGFDDVFTFVESMQTHEGQVKAFVQFIKNSKLDDELQNKDWAGFAKGYNGKNYKGDPNTVEDDYDWKLSRAYQRYLAQEEPKKPLPKSKTAVVTTIGATVAGGAIYGTNDALDTLATVQDGLATLADNAEVIKGVGSQVTELAAKVDGLSMLPLFVGGTFALVLLLFVFVLYVYLVDHGYIKGLGK